MSLNIIRECLQSFPASGSFQMSQFFTSGGQSIGVSASASVLPMNIQDWFPFGLGCGCHQPFCFHPIAQNSVTWHYWAAREAGKCLFGTAMCPAKSEDSLSRLEGEKGYYHSFVLWVIFYVWASSFTIILWSQFDYSHLTDEEILPKITVISPPA